MSFRLKLLACFGSLLAGILAAALQTINARQTAQAQEQVRAGLVGAEFVFGSLLERREQQLKTNLRLLSGDFAFKEALATADPETILSATLNHKQRIQADIMFVADAEGLALADTGGYFAPGRSMKSVGAVAQALEEQPGYSIHLLDEKPYQVACVPITAPDLIGVVAAGFSIDNALAAELKRLTDTEIAFVGKTKVLATTLEPSRAKALEAHLEGLPHNVPGLRALAGENYLALLSPVSRDVSALVLRSWDRALEPMRRLRRTLLIIGAAGLAATAFLGLLIAAGVTASLEKLVAATAKIAKGEYDIALDIRSKDEIGRLAESFGEMAKGLVEREKIRSVLSKTVSKEIAEALLAKGQIELGGEERAVTVLFSDIRSFTTISESLRPAELVSQLNAYFIAMARAIDGQHGVIDKYVGDAIMALFGAPLSSPEDAGHGVRAALAMVTALDVLNVERQSKGLKPWNNGIGLNTGTVVAGTLGSEDRWSYTVIGDAVNLASRLEALTKHYGVKVLISEATRLAAGGGIATRSLDRVVVKGKTAPVEIFEAIGEGAPPPWAAQFDDGVRAYRSKDWKSAKAVFEATLAARPGDAPSRLYIERMAETDPATLPADWNAAVTMTEK